jgi:hypothetical protein
MLNEVSVPRSNIRITPQPLPCSSSVACTVVVMQSVSSQRVSKHIPAATNKHTTLELLLETLLSIRSLQSGNKEDKWGDPVRNQ